MPFMIFKMIMHGNPYVSDNNLFIAHLPKNSDQVVFINRKKVNPNILLNFC